MSDIGALIVVLAAQISLPLLGGLLLSRRRNAAAACTPLIFAAAAALALTPLAFMPKPSFDVSVPAASREHSDTEVDNAAPSTASSPPGIDVLQLLRLPKSETTVKREPQFDVWRWAAIVLCLLAAFGLTQFTFGLLATTRLVRRGRPINDASLRILVDELSQTFACRHSIDLRESERIGSAATAGWLRPTVLLSPAWRHWSSAELRAVVAHEIAHIARGDFAARVLARLTVALHGYHPLARWLAGRLELKQEMAADQLAASTCGGRPAYAKCLAALALQADARPVGFVPTFLSRPRTLLRRIAMLRVTEDTANRSRRWPTLAAMLFLAAVALGLHGTTPESLAGPVVPARFVDKDRTPLDVSLVLPTNNENEVGVFAIRVGELCRTPGMDKIAETYSGAIAAALGDPKKSHFKLTDIDQIAGRVALTHDKTKPSPNRSLSMSLTTIRMVKEFDWVKQLKDWCSDWKEHTHADTKYYSGKASVPALGFFDTAVWFYLPDGRTAVLESEENIKTLIDVKKKPRPAVAWADDWKAVEGSTLALVLPDLKDKVAKKLPTDETADKVQTAIFKALNGVCAKGKRAAVGVDLDAGLSIKLRIACANAADAAEVDESCQAIAKIAKTIINDEADEQLDELAKASKKVSVMLVNGIEFGKSVDHVVEIRLTAKSGIADLIKALKVGSK